MADQGAEQCGFCSPGFVMNVSAMKKELKNPTEDEIKHYLAGNLCRCTGYMRYRFRSEDWKTIHVSMEQYQHNRENCLK